jgi:DNA-binding NtrC family response regulator
MNKKGPIVIIEEDEEDRKLFAEIFSDLKLTNRLFCFNSCNEAYQYLIAERIKPFLLFSNIVLFQGGQEQSFYNEHKSLCFEFRCPCLFFTTLFNQCFIIDTYSIPTHSYFVKPYSFEKFKHVVDSIIQYWSKDKSMRQYRSRAIYNRVS